jgi:translation initiation factor IF-2
LNWEHRLAKRIFEVAKELGVTGKAIVAKCHAEGIPDTVVRNHMSTLGAGLEATIREWFSQAAVTATSVEQTAHVDLEKVKSKKKPASRKKKSEGDHDPESSQDGGSVTTIEAEPVVAREPEAPVTHKDRGAPTKSIPEVPVEPPQPAPEARHEEVAAPSKPAPSRVMVSSISATPPPARSMPAPKARPSQMEEAKPTHPPHTSTKPAMPQARPTATTSSPSAPPPEAGEPPATGNRTPGTNTVARSTSNPAPTNVPRRPTSVTPAGPKLQQAAPVRLSGPKVVRVEAPENIEPPRPRRPATGGHTGPRTGGPGTAGEDDRGRNTRRAPTAGGAPASGAGANNARRSSGTGVPDKRRGRSGQDWVGSTQGIFTEQDLLEREARLARAGGFVKKHAKDVRRPGAGPQQTPAQIGGKVQITAPFTIKDISAATGVKAADIVKKLFLQGVMATINSGIDVVKAQEIMMDFNIELEVQEAKTAEETVSSESEDRITVDQRPRGPVVTILGHVDHGKTSLLDKIRNANVASGEAGGITQRTSAFRVPLDVNGEKKEIVFLDTPGHEAFTGMRSRGANMTDVVVLVVSAPEGVMPQTVESISHAKAAGVPIVVALNKIDRPDATENQIQKTLGQLAEKGINPVAWGGDVEVVQTSATTGAGIAKLLETLDLQAQVLELKADFAGAARGTVIEARTEEGRGAVANILIQQGRLKVGDFIVLGRGFGRIRDITDDRGQRIKEAFPPMPVQLSGIDEVPDAGDKFYVVDTLKKAQEAAEQRRHRERQVQLAQPKLTLDTLFNQMADKDVKEILVVLKAAEQGTVDVLKSECEKVKSDEVRVRVLHSAIGGITESDVVLADASRAIIIGFNVIPSGKARGLAEQKGVEIRTYEVIYDIVEDLKKAAEGLLTPELRQEVLGHAEVRKVFKVTKVGNIAGCYVTDGVVQRDALIRVTRNGVVVENNRKLAQLKRVKDDAKEVRMGMECGMKIDGYDDIKEGDVLECYKQVEVKRTL